jgi:Domain of unknown function(DUF2779)
MRTLSKSDYTLTRTCDTKLYFRENRFPSNSSPYLQLLANGGFMVEALARAQRPGGILLESGWDPVHDFSMTRELLERDAVTLFQATLLSGRRLARVDIVEKTGLDVRLIEVKAKSFDSDEHDADIAKGGKGEFRSNRKPFAHAASWVLKFEDLTYQVLLFEKLFPHLRVHPVLMVVDKARRTSVDSAPKLFDLERRKFGDGTEHTFSATFLGSEGDATKLDILASIDAAADVAELRAIVDAEATRFESLVDAPFDRSLVALDTKCKECQFRVDAPLERNGFAQCWGPMANVTPHVLELYKAGTVSAADGLPIVESMTRAGKASLLDVPIDRLVKKDGSVGPQAERQRRQIEHTRTGKEWIGPALKSKVEALTYPMHFIDFEALRLAVPYHANMRPYGQVAFQWSVHTVDAPGAAPRHAEWLNAEDAWPNVTFARLLRDVIGDRGTVLTWSGFENATLKELAREHSHFSAHDPSLIAWVDELNKSRLVDLWKWAENDYYHPGMKGSTSIKVVLDALWKADSVLRDQFTAWTGRGASPDDDPYLALPPLEIDDVPVNVHEGTGAVLAYEAMMYGVEKDDSETKRKWRDLLLQYCELDTLSMVLIFEYWRRAAKVA